MCRKSEERRSTAAADAATASDSSKQVPGAASPPKSANQAATFGRGLKFRGEITGQGDFFYDGDFEGKIHLDDGTFTVGPNARVNAEIEARQIIVRGEVIGTLKASEGVHISSTAKVTGNMDTRGIVIEDGAELHSKVASPQSAATEAASEVATTEAAREVAGKATPEAVQEIASAEPLVPEKDQEPQAAQSAPPRGKRAAAGASRQSGPQES